MNADKASGSIKDCRGVLLSDGAHILPGFGMRTTDLDSLDGEIRASRLDVGTAE